MKSSTLIVSCGAGLGLIVWFFGIIVLTRISMIGAMEPEPLFYMGRYFDIPYHLLAHILPKNLNQTLLGTILYEGMAYIIHSIVYTLIIWLAVKVFYRPRVAF